MQIEWNKVTWYSKTFTVVVFIGSFFLAFYLGQEYGELKAIIEQSSTMLEAERNTIKAAVFNCSDDKSFHAVFFDDKAELNLSDGRSVLLLRAMSASGIRYTNADESLVFWNKGNTAFIQEGEISTYDNCLATPVE